MSTRGLGSRRDPVGEPRERRGLLQVRLGAARSSTRDPSLAGGPLAGDLLRGPLPRAPAPAVGTCRSSTAPW